MYLLPRNNFWRSLRHRLVVVVMLSSYLATTLNLPLPQPTHKTSGLPFPCQNHPCGCQNAEDCWRHCCCFSVEERWAWARSHNVQPPSYAERPTTSGWRTTRLRDQAGKKTPSGCPSCNVSASSARNGQPGQESKPASSCPACAAQPSKPTPTGSASCCQRPERPSEGQPPAPKKGSRWAYGWNALRCQGLTTLWVSAGAVAPPPPQVRWEPCLVPAGWLSSPDVFLHGFLTSPPDPPPRPDCA
jgi:hypothetical protein